MSDSCMVPRAITDESGEVVAVAHVAPDISERGMAAIAELVAAVRRQMEAEDAADPERVVRREAAAVRRRERVERWRREAGGTR